ncbi:porin [Vibrio japonicus]|uniref:Porin n=1 Tax=Vibrio japonicus TaxID=1824638 RepID=A0ABY5LG16_9VIBR|nr:porin [Vibrio japonicus]UUM30988.1 hypothetical protein NP165_02230 [Vibrio japonicus]
MKRQSIFCLLSPIFLLSQASYADVTLYENDHYELEAYGKLKAVLHYKQHQSPATQFQDDSSRVGFKGKYELVPDVSLRGVVEVGSHFNQSHHDDLFSLRLAHVGVDTDYGMVAWGKQEALIHNLDNYDFSNKLGGVAHYTRDEMNNKRNENTLSYQLDWQDWRLEAQANGSRKLDRSVRLRAGGESLKVAETEVEDGLGFGIRYKIEPHNIQLRVASQLTNYQHGSTAWSVAATGVKTGKLSSGQNWRLGATLGYYSLEDGTESASAQTVGVSGKVQLLDPVHAYVTAESISGKKDISRGHEHAVTSGVEYHITKDAKVYTEAQQSWFDSSKEDQRQWVLGGVYQF